MITHEAPAITTVNINRSTRDTTYQCGVVWHTAAGSPPGAVWGCWSQRLGPPDPLPSDAPVAGPDPANAGLPQPEKHTQCEKHRPALPSGEHRLYQCTHIYRSLTCSFRLCDWASSFCWRVSSLASYCSRMAAVSLSCCSRVRVRVSERHSSIICCFMLSIAASATRCCFTLCVRTRFLLQGFSHYFNKP